VFNVQFTLKLLEPFKLQRVTIVKKSGEFGYIALDEWIYELKILVGLTLFKYAVPNHSK